MITSNDDINKITSNIRLGNYNSAKNISYLKKENINKVLCLMNYNFPIYSKDDNINQKIIKVSDVPTANIIKYFGESLNFIDGKDNTLIHCMAGASRSATIVIAYIMWIKKMKYDDASQLVRDKRFIVCPNFGFREQLKMFEKLLIENDYDINRINFKAIIWNRALGTSYI